MPDDDDIELLQQAITHGGTQAFEIVPLALKKVITEKQWERRGFTLFEAFVTDRGLNGLAMTIDDLKAFCRKAPDVVQLIQAEVGPIVEQPHDEKGRFSRSDIVTTDRGNNPTYALKRLKRDRPDLAAKVIVGELSANAAAIEAGFRKKLTPLEQVLRLLPKLTKADCLVVRDHIAVVLDPPVAGREPGT